jgi:hypothetical protein
MKKRLFFIAFVIIGSNAGFTQADSLNIDLKISNINFSQIFSQISDSSSQYYYQDLFERYKNGDEELGFIEYNYLYYGYTFQKEYQPYGRSDIEDDIKLILEQKNLEPSDYEIVIKLGEKVLEEYPFNIDIIFYMYNWYNIIGDAETASLWERKFTLLLDVIFASGDGKNPESAFVVSGIDDEYIVLTMLGLSMKNQSLISTEKGMCDYMEVKKNENNLEGIYFNVQRLFDKINSSYNF